MGTSAVKKASEMACSADVSSLVIRPTLAFKIRATFVTRPSRDDELICPDASVDRAQCGGDRSAGEAASQAVERAAESLRGSVDGFLRKIAI